MKSPLEAPRPLNRREIGRRRVAKLWWRVSRSNWRDCGGERETESPASGQTRTMCHLQAWTILTCALILLRESWRLIYCVLWSTNLMAIELLHEE